MIIEIVHASHGKEIKGHKDPAMHYWQHLCIVSDVSKSTVQFRCRLKKTMCSHARNCCRGSSTFVTMGCVGCSAISWRRSATSSASCDEDSLYFSTLMPSVMPGTLPSCASTGSSFPATTRTQTSYPAHPIGRSQALSAASNQNRY